MNDDEAKALLDHELEAFRTESYEQLVTRMAAGSLEFGRVGPSGARYQVEIQFFWDGPRGGDIRVMGSIDDGRWRAIVPLNRDFVKAPDGSFVGE